MPSDITKYGPQSGRSLQRVNNQRFANSNLPTPEEITAARNRYAIGAVGAPSGDFSQPVPYSLDTGMGKWGTSQYDDSFLNQPMSDDELQDTRYENQAWYDTLANGTVKMLGTAGTTFLSSLIGLPAGIGTAMLEGRPSGVWDNAVTKVLGDVDDWLEDNFTNYKSVEQQNSPWYSLSNLGSMNFWADDVIKNAGFTLGAAASMAVGSGSLGLISKAFSAVNETSRNAGMAGKFASALFSATGEGMIEAKQGVEERNKLEMQKLEDALAPERQALATEFQLADEEYRATMGQSLVTGADGKAYDPAYIKYNQKLRELNERQNIINQRYAEGKNQIEASGRDMGNQILLGNQVLLTAGNLIQFGKLMSKSFDNAKHIAEVTSKSSKPFGVMAKKAGESAKDGYEILGKNFGRTAAATKGLLTEGSEEMNQQFIQSSAGAYYNEKDVNDYWKARLNQDSYRETTKDLYSLGNTISQGFSESWGDVNQWEQFVIGGLTGMAGSYAPTKLFNQDKTKSIIDPRRYGSWEGGMYNEVRDFNNQYNQYKKNIDDLNKVLSQENFGERTRSLIAHSYLENQKEEAALAGDKKRWKDEDDKQAIHDIQAFYRAGKINDLRAIYEEMGKNLSDEDIEGIVKATTQEMSADRDRQNYLDALDAQIADHRNKINSLNSRAQAIADNAELVDSSDIDSYNIAAQPELDRIATDIAKENAAIDELENKKDGYQGNTKYISPYLNEDGSRKKSNAEIRNEIKHNSEELNRKLNSYLESIQAVQEDTGGRLTNDQEDNLAYLHNLSKESLVRSNRILAGVKKRLPSKFLLKTDKTPEQLTRQYASISPDILFSRDDSTKEGYVEVDTSLMPDNTFASFFIDNIINGQNIGNEEGINDIIDEMKAREEDSKYSEEEQKKRREERNKAQAEKESKRNKQNQKDREEQLRANEDLIREAFVRNAMLNNNQSLQDALESDEYKQLIGDINDAVSLRSQAAQYGETLREYLSNPEKADKDRKKEEDKAEKAEKDKEIDGMFLKDMMEKPDIENINTLRESKKGKNRKGNMAKTSIGLKNTRLDVEKSLDAAVNTGNLDRETAEDAKKLLNVQIDKYMSFYNDDTDQIDSAADVVDKVIDMESDTMQDPWSLLDDTTIQQLESGLADEESLNLDERLEKAKDALNSTKEAARRRVEQLQKDIDMDKVIDSINDYERKQDAPMEKAAQAIETANLDKEQLPKKARSKREDDPEPMRSVATILPTIEEAEKERANSSGEDSVLEEDKSNGTKSLNIPKEDFESSWHPWMSSTSEVGQYTNEPYHPNPSDPDAEFKQGRYDAIRQKLIDLGAYTARKQGRITEDMPVGFKVFQDVNDASKDFVIFITDENGNVIGDMPSNDPRLATSRRDVQMDDFYAAIREEWDNATDEEKKNGMQSKYTSQIDHVLVGKVLYQDNRQTVSSLMSGSGRAPQFAIMTRAGMHTGRNKNGNPIVTDVWPPKTGSPGQPYVLVSTPKIHSGEGMFSYYAVPIKTLTVGEAAPNTTFIKVLKTLLDNIKQGKVSDSQAAQLLESLLAVANVHVNLEAGSNSKKGLGIHLTTYDRKERTEKHNTWPIFEGKREDMDIDRIMEALGRFSINVSASFINGNENNYAYPFTVNGKQVDYNEMIAEVSNTNAASPETVNDWFTVRPLVKSNNKLEMVKQKDRKTEWRHVEPGTHFDVVAETGGKKRDWKVEIATWKVFDERGNEITRNDGKHSKAEWEEAKRLAAEVWGLHYMRDRETPYAVMVGGESFIYIPSTGKFKTYSEIEKDPKYSFNKLKNGEKLTPGQQYHLMESFLSEIIHDEEMLAEARNWGREKTKKLERREKTTGVSSLFSSKFGPSITDYSYGAQDYFPTFYGNIPSTGERIRIDVDEKNNRYTIWVDRALPGQTNYNPGEGISFNLLVNGTEDEYNKVLEELNLPQEFIDDFPKLYELYRNDLQNDTDSKDEYLSNTWGIEYGHNAPNYKKEPEKDHTTETENTIRKMREDSQKYRLVRWDKEQRKYVDDSRNGNYYMDDRGTVHARVSNINDADTDIVAANEKAGFTGDNPAKIPATGAGNAVDRFIRDVFAGGDPLQGFNSSNPEENRAALEQARNIYRRIGSSNISEEDGANLIVALHNMLHNVNERETVGEWVIDSSGIVAEGMVDFGNGNIVHVAGTIDLLMYNKKRGAYSIVDMKTHKADIYDGKGNLRIGDAKVDATIAHWRAQQTLYKNFLEKKYGIKISGLRILPLSVNYSTKFKETQYEIGDDGVLTDKGIPVDVHPVYDGMLIRLEPKDHVNYDLGHLPENVRNLLPKLNPVIRKPADRKVPIREQLRDIADRTPEGRKLREFISEEYADNEDILKLADILDENRNSDSPILMTSASQDTILAAIDMAALASAVEEALAAENDIPLEIPEQEEPSIEDTAEEMFDNGSLNVEFRDVFDDLSDSSKRTVVESSDAASLFNEMASNGESADDIDEAIGNMPVIRHKKATEKPYKILDIKKELRWLNKVLPQLSSERRMQIVKGLVKCSDGSADFGRLQGDIIMIGTHAGEGTVYHEAFHAVVQFLLTDEEIEKLYQAARNRWGDLNPVVLEEKLADEFEYYTRGLEYEAGSIKKFFRDLWNAIKALFTNRSYMDNLFRNINSGVYSGREFRDDRNNIFSNIRNEQREHTRDYAFLTASERQRIQEAGISPDIYNKMTKEQKEYMLHCVI